MLCGEGGSEELPECLYVLSGQLFKIVLGFTPRRRPWKAGPSQNDDFLPRFGIYPFWKALQGTSIPKRFGTTLFRPLCGPSGGLCGTSQPCFAASRCHPGISKVVSASRQPPRQPPRWPRWRRGGFLCGRKSGGDLQPHASTSRQNQKDGDRGPRGRLRISDR